MYSRFNVLCFTKLLKDCIFCHQTVFQNTSQMTSTKLQGLFQASVGAILTFPYVSSFCFCFCCQTFAIGSVKLLSKPNHKYGMLWKPLLVFQYQRSRVGKQQQHNQLIGVISEMLSKVTDQPSKD